MGGHGVTSLHVGGHGVTSLHEMQKKNLPWCWWILPREQRTTHLSQYHIRRGHAKNGAHVILIGLCAGDVHEDLQRRLCVALLFGGQQQQRPQHLVAHLLSSDARL